MANITRRALMRQILLAAALPFSGCAKAPAEFVQRTLFHFDTVCVLGGAMAEDVLDEAQELCDRFEQLFSRTVATSDVGRVNAAGGEEVEVDPLTAELVSLALGYSEESDGLFDITIGAVSELWNFQDGVVPGDEAIREAVAHVGWRQVRVRGNTIQLADPLARIDLGGIAKGFMTDKLMELFAEHGVQNAFVNLGGNVAVLGNSEKGAPWSVGVRDPFDESGAGVVARITTTNGSLVTSGLYERSFEKDGKRYWHILDPRTGHPVQTDLVSASIFGAKSIDGDGYTKPLFMLSEGEALDFVQERDGLQALLVFQNGSMRATRGASFVLL